MGYYTRFYLEIEGTGERWVTGVDKDGNKVEVNIWLSTDEIQEEIESLSGYGPNLFEESHKWYEHDENMREISAKYPDLLFTLSGEGEEAGDMWRAYYKGGKCQRELAKIEYGRFDPALLK